MDPKRATFSKRQIGRRQKCLLAIVLALSASFAVIWFWLGPNAYNGRAYIHYEKKEYEEAISDYTEAIRLKPNDAEAYNNRGPLTTPKMSTTRRSATTQRKSGSSRTMPTSITIVGAPTQA
jgi:tetratricopeptide (TPR) repeat protein